MARIILVLCSLFRYRFFLFAGIFPYFLGQVIAFSSQGTLNLLNFRLGFLGIALALTGVEFFNEYFDAEEGGDRIFSLEEHKVPKSFLLYGLCSMFCAFLIGIFFTLQIGWPVLLFCILGFLAAYFYVGPPIRWAYQGLGEMVIAFSYGPSMVLGSYYLQSKRIDWTPFFVSLICGLVLFTLAVINEIPDYYQDRLVGKKNLVVRLGKRGALRLLYIVYSILFIFLGGGIFLKILPVSAGIVFFILPWLVKSLKRVRDNLDTPKVFLSAINVNLVLFLLISISLGVGYLVE